MYNPTIFISEPSIIHAEALSLEPGSFVHVQNPNPAESPLEGYIISLEHSKAAVEICRRKHWTTPRHVTAANLVPLPPLSQGRNTRLKGLTSPCGHFKLGVRCEASETSRPSEKWIVQIIPPEGYTTSICACGVLQAHNVYKVRRQRPLAIHIEHFPLINKEGTFVNPRLTPIPASRIVNTECWDDRLQQLFLPTPASVTCSLIDSGIGFSPSEPSTSLPRIASPPALQPTPGASQGSRRARHFARRGSMDVVLYPRSPRKEESHLTEDERAGVDTLRGFFTPQRVLPAQLPPFPNKWHDGANISSDLIENWRRCALSSSGDAMMLFKGGADQYVRQGVN